MREPLDDPNHPGYERVPLWGRVLLLFAGCSAISMGVLPYLKNQGFVYDNWWGDPVFIVFPMMCGILMIYMGIFSPKWMRRKPPKKGRIRGWPRPRARQ